MIDLMNEVAIKAELRPADEPLVGPDQLVQAGERHVEEKQTLIILQILNKNESLQNKIIKNITGIESR